MTELGGTVDWQAIRHTSLTDTDIDFLIKKNYVTQRTFRTCDTEFCQSLASITTVNKRQEQLPQMLQAIIYQLVWRRKVTEIITHTVPQNLVVCVRLIHWVTNDLLIGRKPRTEKHVSIKLCDNTCLTCHRYTYVTKLFQSNIVFGPYDTSGFIM